MFAMLKEFEEDGERENGLIAPDPPSGEPWEKQNGFLSESLDCTSSILKSISKIVCMCACLCQGC